MSLHAKIALQRGPLPIEVELAVARGETLALVGPNGAGKSTCLNAIAGLVPMSRGAIRLGERWLDGGPDHVATPPEQRGIGLLFQDHLLFPHLSALDNVAYGLVARGTPRAAARAKAAAWLSRVGLADRSAARPRELSGGQAQRVALARALAAEPELLLLDEPLAAVDASARQALRRDLGAHLRDFAGPRIVVTHDATDAFLLADRIAVLEAGRVVQTGTAAEISASPRSRYVADLIGLNFFRGTIRDGVLQLPNGAQLVVVSAHEGPAAATLHPRAIALFHERPAGSPRNTWQAPIEALEPSLDSVRVRIGGLAPIVAEVTSGTVATMGLRPGLSVYLAIKATEIRVLPE